MANIKRLEGVAIPSTPKEIRQRYLRRFTNKACKWICKDCDRCVADLERMARCPRLNGFKKAMEE